MTNSFARQGACRSTGLHHYLDGDSYMTMWLVFHLHCSTLQSSSVHTEAALALKLKEMTLAKVTLLPISATV